MRLPDEEKTFLQILEEELETQRSRFPNFILYSDKQNDNTYIMVTLKSLVCYNNREGIRDALNKAYNTVYRPRKDGES